MEKIHQGKGYAIIEDGDKIQISWAQGPFQHIVYYDISRENMEKALKSPEDASDVMFFAETGKWPPSEEEQLENRKEFLRGSPKLLLKIPENQKLFDKEELQILLKKAKELSRKEQTKLP